MQQWANISSFWYEAFGSEPCSKGWQHNSYVTGFAGFANWTSVFFTFWTIGGPQILVSPKTIIWGPTHKLWHHAQEFGGGTVLLIETDSYGL